MRHLKNHLPKIQKEDDVRFCKFCVAVDDYDQKKQVVCARQTSIPICHCIPLIPAQECRGISMLTSLFIHLALSIHHEARHRNYALVVPGGSQAGDRGGRMFDSM